VSRLDELFARCRTEGRAALIGYLPVGFPQYDESVAAMVAMVEGGVDAVEVGVPYSDPGMDGPVIQVAVDQALRQGVRVAQVFEAVKTVSALAPTVVMGYWNPVERYGPARFAKTLKDAGGSGAITPDLIPEEAGPWLDAAREHDLDPIFLVAPSSTDERIAVVGRTNRGFVYAASTMGVTGTRSTVGDRAEELVARVRRHTDLPVCVGLGVSNGAQAAEVAAYADGVIVGSAFVRALDEGGPEAVRALAADLAAGVRQTTRA
jgi:tryptophan synthase alpha chain